jgi:hypothetical protein
MLGIMVIKPQYTPVSLVTEAEAQKKKPIITTFTLNRTLTPSGTAGSEFTSVARFMHGGDIVKFNFTYSPSVNINIRVINSSNEIIFNWLRINGNAQNLQIAIPVSGQYRIRIINSSASTVVTNGNYEHIDYNVSRTARIFFDPLFGGNPNATTILTNNFNQAATGFSTRHGIFLHLNSLSMSTLLNGHLCPNTAYADFCSHSRCGVIANCNNSNTTGHHKGAVSLIERNPLIKSNSIYTTRVVGHGICFFRESTGRHLVTFPDGEGLGGIAEFMGMDTLISDRSKAAINVLIQHELSHNFGASDCIATACVMNANQFPLLNNWCSNCTSVIRQGKHIKYIDDN